MAKWTRRGLLLAGGAAAGAWGAAKLGPELPSLDGTVSLAPAEVPGTLNDASGLSQTPVARHVILNDDPSAALVARLRAEIAEARAVGRPVAVSAARHSMGGQAIPRDGQAITCDNGWVEADRAAGVYRVHAGARWSQVIAALDPLGFSPKVMQSNNDFGLGATFCVNAHGWPVPFGPMGATVRSFRMVMADGEWVTCSREENADLFGMSMGGYGLAGLITDMEVEMVPNRRLVPSYQEMPGADVGQAMARAVAEPAVEMAYGRLNVDRANLFEEGLLITYRADADQTDLPAASGSGWMSHASRHIYRAQLGNETVKRLRWWTETDLAPRLGGPATRNSLINEPVVTLDDRDPARTDILHEYFVAPERFAEFVEACREVIPASYQEFLNVTVRYVAADRESWLSYAPVPRIANVMSFSQEMTARAEADMARMTRELIERVIAIGGSYYLPYRPHATHGQFRRAYPRAAEFATEKRRIDPELRFRNGLWDNYLVAL